MMFPPTLEIAAAPMETEEIAAAPRMERVAATTSSAPPPPSNPPNGASRALSGVPPPIFNGDRDKSELFLDKFTSYEIINGDTKQFTTPYLKVALCLLYLNGPKVDAWARHQRQWLKERHQVDGVPMTDPSLWTDFETNFQAAYSDQDAKLTAYQKLNELRMQGSDIDSYVADFDQLIEEAGYSKYNMGIMIKFKEGLQPSLLREILLHNIPAPTTLVNWKKKARE